MSDDPRTFGPSPLRAAGPENPAAFPMTTTGSRGMTLRDYFAGQALATLNPAMDPESAARAAYRVADALLAARGRRP